jgi:gliding motility-associated-like protein
MCHAGHIAGGEVYYKYLGPGAAANTDKYEITIRLFRECNPPPSSGGQQTAAMPDAVRLGIFRNTNPSTQYGAAVDITRNDLKSISKNTNDPCIVNPPEVCYQVGSFTYTTDLPITPEGYVVSFQTCCRTNGIINIAGASVGATYAAEIPGTSITGTGKNHSAIFSTANDAQLICKNSKFTLDFSAKDEDGDELVYSFCPAYNGGPTINSAPVTPSLPPYGNFSYASSFSGEQPLGSQVSIDSKTGVISGTSPGAGSYVINVCVAEYRSGKLISIHRKDFTLKIGDCTLAAAELPQPGYAAFCKSFTSSFENLSTASNITGYLWEFGDPASGQTNTSTQPKPSHTFSDTGVYTIKLTVQSSAGCSDATTSKVYVYPGFNPDFSSTGSCYQTPFLFQDKTTTAYGTVNSWKWDFGDLSSNTDVSVAKNPSYQYASSGSKNVRLVVGTDKGCIDTIVKAVPVRDVPSLALPFRDTLICSIDTLPLRSVGNGAFSWTPNYNIINSTSANPSVYPKQTTSYIVSLNENGCVKQDTIRVRVLDFITVDAGRDTSICSTDSIILRPVSDALQFSWSPATAMNNSQVKNPVASPTADITYHVVANLGKCQDRDSIRIKVSPYPVANAGGDTSICFSNVAQLQATMSGASFTWAPVNSLQNANTLTPLAKPTTTTTYLLTVRDTLGCPKPVRDSVTVSVVPRVMAFAGNDTTIVANQPLQLNATGGTGYAWLPVTGMNDGSIANPLVTLNATVDTITYRVRVSTPEGCFASDDMKVTVFKTGPEIFVPSAFTPNTDGKNDVLKPVAVGIKSLTYFKIFNRWGQVVYSSTDLSHGWDGKINGVTQATDTFVYMAEATDYLGNVFKRKGTVVLIR